MAVPLLAPESSACPSKPREQRGSVPPKSTGNPAGQTWIRTQQPGLAQEAAACRAWAGTGQNPAVAALGGYCCRNRCFLQHRHCCSICHLLIVALLLSLLLEAPLEHKLCTAAAGEDTQWSILTGWLLSLSTVASISQICCPSRRISQH